MAVKYCCWDGRRCWHDSCDFITRRGDVLVCSRHGNPSGKFSFRIPKVVPK